MQCDVALRRVDCARFLFVGRIRDFKYVLKSLHWVSSFWAVRNLCGENPSTNGVVLRCISCGNENDTFFFGVGVEACVFVMASCLLT